MSIAAVVTVPGNYDTNEMDESGPEDLKRPLSDTATIILDLFNWITHLCLGAVAFSGFLIGLLTIGPFAAHMILCTTGVSSVPYKYFFLLSRPYKLLYQILNKLIITELFKTYLILYDFVNL